jgi:DNA-binding PadR family transcriptional regulator
MAETAQSPRQLLPLTPAVFHILLALAGGEKHGYGIMKEVEISTDGQMVLAPGTLYRSIKQMLEAGFIAECAAPPDVEADDERRRYYELTPFGQQVASAEAERLMKLVQMAQDRHLLGGLNTLPLQGGA